MSSPLRSRLPSGSIGPQPTPPARRRLIKTRHKVYLLLLVGVVAVAITVLAAVARRQRRRPVDYIPPRDDAAN
jgi:hypothetical protein